MDGAARIGVESYSAAYSHVNPLVMRHSCHQPAIGSVCISNGGHWRGGATEVVSWTPVGTLASVNIDLASIRDVFWSESLKLNAENTGHCEVEVPQGLTPGLYRVTVRSPEDFDLSASSAPLSIDAGCEQPRIISVATSNNGCWTSSSAQVVRWTFSGVVPKVSIDLVKADSVVFCGTSLKANVENTGSCEVRVPQSMEPGEYKLAVRSANEFTVRHATTIRLDAVAPEEGSGCLLAQVRQLQRELDDLRSERMCKVCFEREADCALVECGHANVCQACAWQQQSCPMCRRGIVRILPLFR